jgi:hypothetical protein
VRVIERNSTMKHGITAGALLALGALTLGCATSRPAAQTTAPTPASKQLVTGSHIPVPGELRGHAYAEATTPTRAYTRDEIIRTGAGDVPSFLRRLPWARVH